MPTEANGTARRAAAPTIRRCPDLCDAASSSPSIRTRRVIHVRALLSTRSHGTLPHCKGEPIASHFVKTWSCLRREGPRRSSGRRREPRPYVAFPLRATREAPLVITLTTTVAACSRRTRTCASAGQRQAAGGTAPRSSPPSLAAHQPHWSSAIAARQPRPPAPSSPSPSAARRGLYAARATQGGVGGAAERGLRRHRSGVLVVARARSPEEVGGCSHSRRGHRAPVRCSPHAPPPRPTPSEPRAHARRRAVIAHPDRRRSPRRTATGFPPRGPPCSRARRALLHFADTPAPPGPRHHLRLGVRDLMLLRPAPPTRPATCSLRLTSASSSPATSDRGRRHHLVDGNSANSSPLSTDWRRSRPRRVVGHGS